ncbi:glycosyltransferase [Acuticoccus sp. M5D2P5]|uniref:glycosyltransferase n=1 Tax=Acuticoccus kalidii TaxID=2910977 RepID=UPI001F2B58C2|nr:glycosyltransferase [Acuticoccus kalidii]MCF3936048.1 glycosyltransferase [Acuticoccus kalidii]
MKIVFASHGSLGDLVPFLEIGKVLRRAGHGVTVATHRAHETAVAAAGLDFAPMRPDRPADPDFHARFMHPRRGPAFIFREVLGPHIAESDADLGAALMGADRLVSVTLALAAPLAAARSGVPWRSAVFQPAMLYSAQDPPKLPMLPFVRGAPGYNRWLLNVAKKGVEDWAAPLRAYRAAEGLGVYPDHPAFGGQHAPGGVLALYSPLFGRLPSDAPANTVQTGQVLQTGRAALDPAIEAFLAAGPAPIVFTLGSASSHVARRFFHESAAIAERLGMRALLLVGTEANAAGLPARPDRLVALAAPYQAVFERAAFVVSQGGIGTIALALSAGVPMALVPFAHDQPDNAARVARTGAARVIPRWRYGRAAAAIGAMIADPRMRAAAEAAAATINAERGAERAAAEILAAR